MTSCANKLKTKILELSNSNDYERACLEWVPVIFSVNNVIEENQLGYQFKNQCHNTINDNCYCVLGNRSREEVSKVTKKPKRPEHCRWVNFRNLELFQSNTLTNYSCICGEPIIYIYKIKNKLNGNIIPSDENSPGIGCECIKKFLPNCYEELQQYATQHIKETYAHRFCYNCGRRHKRKNMMVGEVVNCKKCPELCCILDCVNEAFKKNLCSKHLRGF